MTTVPATGGSYQPTPKQDADPYFGVVHKIDGMITSLQTDGRGGWVGVRPLRCRGAAPDYPPVR